MNNLKCALMMALFSAYQKAQESLSGNERALAPLWRQVSDCTNLAALARLAAEAWPHLPASLPSSHRDLLHELRLISERPQPLDERTEFEHLANLPALIGAREWDEGLEPLRGAARA